MGAVVTLAAAQKRGFARRLMQHTAKFLEQQWKVDAGLLFCLPKLVAYYEALGWKKVENPVLIEQPSSTIVVPFCVMVLPFSEEGLISGTIEVRSLRW